MALYEYAKEKERKRYKQEQQKIAEKAAPNFTHRNTHKYTPSFTFEEEEQKKRFNNSNNTKHRFEREKCACRLTCWGVRIIIFCDSYSLLSPLSVSILPALTCTLKSHLQDIYAALLPSCARSKRLDVSFTGAVSSERKAWEKKKPGKIDSCRR